jgi:hypothetical protein
MKKQFIFIGIVAVAATSIIVGCGQKRDTSALLKPDSLTSVSDQAKKFQETLKDQQSLSSTEIKVDRVVEGGKAGPKAAGEATKAGEPKQNSEPADEGQVSQRIENQVSQIVEGAKKRTGASGYVQFDISVGADGTIKSFNMIHNDLDAQAAASIKASVMRNKYSSFDSKYPDFKPGTFKITF